MKSLAFGLFACLICLSLPAQTTESGDLVARVNAIISAMPGASGDDYSAPSAAQKTDWDALLTDLFAGSYAAANTKAAALGYDLVEFTDTGNGTVFTCSKPLRAAQIIGVPMCSIRVPVAPNLS